MLMAALMINELQGTIVECVPNQLVPYGPGYGTGPQGCAIAGAQPGETTLLGQSWANTALGFYQSHRWRNFGIIIGLWLAFLVLCCILIERLPAAGSNQAILLYKRGGGGKFIRASNQNGDEPRDEEEGTGRTQVNEKPGKGSEDVDLKKEIHAAET